MKKIRSFVDKLVGQFLVIILGLMVINVLWQVFTRFFTNNPSSFTDELARYLMIWLGILGAAYVAGRNEHVAIDVFLKKIDQKYQKFIFWFISFNIFSFALFALVIGGSRLVYITIKLEQYSPALKIPIGLIYSVVPISGVLILFYKITQQFK
jgi:TRAP-type C4-dicarboxylate transport system permease small subunit